MRVSAHSKVWLWCVTWSHGSSPEALEEGVTDCRAE